MPANHFSLAFSNIVPFGLVVRSTPVEVVAYCSKSLIRRIGMSLYPMSDKVVYLTLDLSSSRIQMAALGHTSTSFCFDICQFHGFFPGQVHLFVVSFDDIYPVLPWSSWLSLVTSQLPVCCLRVWLITASTRIGTDFDHIDTAKQGQGYKSIVSFTVW